MCFSRLSCECSDLFNLSLSTVYINGELFAQALTPKIPLKNSIIDLRTKEISSTTIHLGTSIIKLKN